jgi:hypothetical protein
MAVLVDPVFWFNFPSQCKTSTAYRAGEVAVAVAVLTMLAAVAVAAVWQAEREVDKALVHNKQLVEPDSPVV